MNLFAVEEEGENVQTPQAVYPFLIKAGWLAFLFFYGTITSFCQAPAYEVNLINKEKGLSDNSSHRAFIDSRGYVWILTFDGLNRYDGKSIKIFKSGADSTSLSADFVKKMAEDTQGNLWMTVENGGFCKFDPRTETFETYRPPKTELNYGGEENLADIRIDDNGLIWLGRQVGRGFFTFNPVTLDFQHFLLPGSSEIVFRTIQYPDAENEVWLYADYGLWKYDVGQRMFEKVLSDGYGHTLAYREDINSWWLGSLGEGLFRFNLKTKELTSYINKENHLFFKEIDNSGKYKRIGHPFNDLSYREKNYFPALVSGIHPLDSNRLLLACYSYDGMHVFDKKTGVTSRLIEDSTLVQTDLFLRGTNIVEDDYGRLWFGTRPSYYVKPDGMYMLDPVTYKKLETPIVWTDLLVNNEHFKSSVNINYLEEIVLQSHENVLNIGFALLNYSTPDSNRYEYQLVGVDKDWRQTDQEKNYAFYKELSPGNYTFKVKGKHPKGFYSEELILPIHIIPQWYQTLWAKLLFVLLSVGVIWAIYKNQINRIQQKNRLAQELAEAGRVQELNRAKSRLYTNITHEFRTPLTVILGLTEQLKSKPEADWESYLNTIYKNGDQLLGLVNQLLDISKIEEGAFQVQYVQGDIMRYLQYLTESYNSMAFAQKKHLAFFSEPERFTMDYDSKILQSIIGNLLSNALKFTPEFSKIVVKAIAKESQLLLTITDTGDGIPAEFLDHIFDRFYQVDDSDSRKSEGAGIGLALVKEMVQLLEGTIEVESEMSRGTTFKLTLPVHRKALQEEPVLEPIHVLLPTSTDAVSDLTDANLIDNQRPQLLIIEDHPDVVLYLKACLEEHYSCYVARNGLEGVEMAKELIPDIIISDVMMPKMDGFEVCAQLKTNSKTSHIPILLLTAKATVEDRIEGLSQGADAYLVKPFNKEELLVRMKQLIALRKQLQERYSGSQFLTDPNIASHEKDFLSQLIEIIHTHLSDEDFQIAHLCRAAGMSRTQLHRKIKALTAKSTSVFIKKIKLERAKMLLKTTDKSVSEIAYSIGYKYPNHFSTDFKNEYGTAPQENRE